MQQVLLVAVRSHLRLAIVTINGWNRLSVAFRAVPGAYQPVHHYIRSH